MVYASHDGFRSAEITSGINAAITGSEEGDMELRDMSDKEMRELDAWICKHVLGYEKAHCGWAMAGRVVEPTRNSEDAMAVLKKCADKTPQIMISIYKGTWVVGNNTLDNLSKAETLELAICKFAKQLFSK